MDILQLGLLGANCYLLWEGSDCVAIDPGGEANRVLARIGELGAELRAVVLTHGHFDHVGAAGKLAEATGCRVTDMPEMLELYKAMALHRLCSQ